MNGTLYGFSIKCSAFIWSVKSLARLNGASHSLQKIFLIGVLAFLTFFTKSRLFETNRFDLIVNFYSMQNWKIKIYSTVAIISRVKLKLFMKKLTSNVKISMFINVQACRMHTYGKKGARNGCKTFIYE